MSRRAELVEQAKDLGIKVPFGVSNDALEELIRLHETGSGAEVYGVPDQAPAFDPPWPEASPEAQTLVETPIPDRERRPWDPLAGY